MSIDIFSRSRQLLGESGITTLLQKHVIVFGVGGVGGNCIETLVRTGIGEITIVDNDVVSLTNINRQIVALHSTIGKLKVDVMEERLLDINPNLIVHKKNLFVDKDTIEQFNFTDYDYVVDAIDTISAKLMIIERCVAVNTQIISCMGAGNKLNSSQLKIMDIYKTNYCPLAKVMRHELKKRRIKKLKVLASDEPIIQPEASEEVTNKRVVPGSIAFVPNVAGILIAREVILDSIK